MSTLDLEGARLRRDIYRPHETDCWQRGSSCCTAHTSAEDVPSLIAEVERLRAVMVSTAGRLDEYADTCCETADRITMRTLAGQMRTAVES